MQSQQGLESGESIRRALDLNPVDVVNMPTVNPKITTTNLVARTINISFWLPDFECLVFINKIPNVSTVM